MDLVVLAIAVTCVFIVGAAAQAVTGFGCALVAVPVLAVLLGPTRAVVVTVAVSCAIAAFGYWRERAHVDTPMAVRMSLAGVVGMPFGLVALSLMDERSMTIFIAVVVLVLAVALAGRVQLPTGRRVDVAAGVAAGALEVSTGMNGPPIVLAVQSAGLPPRRFRGTLQAIFFCQGCFALLLLVVLGHGNGSCVVLALSGLLGVPLGWRVGDWVFVRMSAAVFRRMVITGLAVTALAALAGAV